MTMKQRKVGGQGYAPAACSHLWKFVGVHGERELDVDWCFQCGALRKQEYNEKSAKTRRRIFVPVANGRMRDGDQRQ